VQRTGAVSRDGGTVVKKPGGVTQLQIGSCSSRLPCAACSSCSSWQPR